MASKHEMVGPKASIPEGVFSSNETDIISHGPLNRTKIMRIAHVDESDHHDYAEGQEIDMCLVGIFGAKMVIHLHPVNKIPFHGVYTLARTIVKNRWLPFFIDKDLKLFLHF